VISTCHHASLRLTYMPLLLMTSVREGWSAAICPHFMRLCYGL